MSNEISGRETLDPEIEQEMRQRAARYVAEVMASPRRANNGEGDAAGIGDAQPTPIHVYEPVDEADGINRPMPKMHSTPLSEEQLRELIAQIDPENASVDWATRDEPVPNVNRRYDDDRWAYFVEVAPGMWVAFDDLPNELAEALTHTYSEGLRMRPIQRPFSEKELAELIEEIRLIDPATAVCDWSYAEMCDPYCLGNVPHLIVGREYFVRASGDRWVWFDDLPKEVREALHEKHRRNLDFPAGLQERLERLGLA